MKGLTDLVEFRYVNDAIAAASNTDDNSTIIDMAGYESVTFITPITDSVAGGVATATIQHNDSNSDSGMAAVTGAAATKTSLVNDDINGTLLVVELRKPAKRYVQCTLTSATQNIAFGATLAILKPYELPAENSATVSDKEYVSN